MRFHSCFPAAVGALAILTLAGCGDDSTSPEADAAAIDDADASSDAGSDALVEDTGSIDISEEGSAPDAEDDASDAVATDVARDAFDGSAQPDASDGSAEPDAVEVDAGPVIPPWPAARPGCNGHEELCDRPFDEVVFPSTHNSMSNAQDDWGIPNQNLNLRSQLSDGIRGFLLDVFEDNGRLKLCHSICVIGQRDLIDAFEEFSDFLAQNPGEVISFLIEDNISAEQLAGALDAGGLADYAIVHEPGAAWPTLGELIEADTRLLVTTQDAGPPPEIIHNLWSLAWDTDYTYASVDDFECGRNRGQTSNALFLLNHWLSAPASLPEYGPVANEYSVLMDRVETCRSEWERLPSFLAVDYYDAGDLFEVVDVLNGVAPARD
jgi:hypothetical protein